VPDIENCKFHKYVISIKALIIKKLSLPFAATQRIDSDIIFHYHTSVSKIISRRILKEF